jgi:hypothetical protein
MCKRNAMNIVPDYWPFSSDYYHTSGRAGQVRLAHIKAPASVFPRRRPPDTNSFCGISAVDHRNAPKVTHSPGAPLPKGLAWCPKCLGLAAVHLGVIADVEAVVLGALSVRLGAMPTAEELLARQP